MKRLNELGIDFVGKKKIWYVISLVIIAAGIVSLFAQQLNFGIDFTGGSIIQVEFAEEVQLADVRDVVTHATQQEPTIQSSDNKEFLIRTMALSDNDTDALLSTIEAQLGSFNVLRNDFIGPIIGAELLRNALLALSLAMVLMLAYIAFRFKFRFAVAAIIPLIHDALVTISIFSLLQIEVNSVFVAAILTVIGYSINNTIVVFDRIRENMTEGRKMDFGQTVNLSINQTMTRSVNTVLAVLFFLVSLLLFGGETTRIFALAMTIGVVAGTYSSMCIAGCLLVDFKAGGSIKQGFKAKAVRLR